MNAIENFYEVVKFGRPEYIPWKTPDYGLRYHGSNHEDFEGHGHHSPVGTEWTDIWGTVWHKDLPDVMAFPKRFPLEDLETLDAYTFVDPDGEKYTGLIAELLEKHNPKEAILAGSHRDTLWERAYMLVGMETLMEYFYTEPDLVKRLFRKITDFHLRMAEHYVAAGCKIAYLSDDHGTQNSLLLGEKIIREFFLPEYERLFGYYKANGVLINFHSCGHIEPMLDIFMDLGVDILNPIQASANDLDAIRAKTQGRMAILGGVNSEVLMNGTADEIRDLTKLRMEQLGKNGGYICTPDQWMPFPKDAVEILEDTVQKYGRYPL